MANTYLPIAISLEHRKCLIVGGGRVALRKIETLLEYNSNITIIAPEVEDRIEYYAGKEMLTLHKRPYKAKDASPFGLVISASDDEDVNCQVYDDCQATGIPVNVVDNPPLCDFIFPAVLSRDCMTVAISTDGKAPFLSGHLRHVLENIFPRHWNDLVQLAVEYRVNVRNYWKGKAEQKHAAFERFVEVDWKSLFDAKDADALQSELHRILIGDPAPEPPEDDKGEQATGNFEE